MQCTKGAYRTGSMDSTRGGEFAVDHDITGATLRLAWLVHWKRWATAEIRISSRRFPLKPEDEVGTVARVRWCSGAGPTSLRSRQKRYPCRRSQGVPAPQEWVATGRPEGVCKRAGCERTLCTDEWVAPSPVESVCADEWKAPSPVESNPKLCNSGIKSGRSHD